MSGLDALQSVQFVSKNGKRLAVLGADDWESLIEWLETIEDVQIAKKAFANLKAAKGNRAKAGWLAWEDVLGGLDLADSTPAGAGIDHVPARPRKKP